MDNDLAVKIKNFLQQAEGDKTTNYKILRIDYGSPLDGFHPWADGRELVAAFRVINQDDLTYYLLIIDWRQIQDFYLVIYPEDRSGPLAEIHKARQSSISEDLCWRYKPTKKDGRNEERKTYFKKYWGDIEVAITIPKISPEVEAFLDDVFDLANNRTKADQLAIESPKYRDVFPEGGAYERLHRVRERSQKVIEMAKKRILKAHGKFVCEICDFDFREFYGDLGFGFIEAHHVVPVSLLQEDSVTGVDDIALVCANCHRMLHWKRPWLSIKQLKKIIEQRS